MKAFAVIGLLASALGVTPAFSQEQWGIAANQMHVRAGPAVDYPVVTIVPAGAPVAVQGCLPDYRWCDVVVGSERGWSYAGNVLYPHDGASVPLLTYGALIGIGIVGFSVAHYWDSYYRHRAWYPQRGHWMGRAPYPGGHGPGHAGFAPGGGHPQPHAGFAPGGGHPQPHAGFAPGGGHPQPHAGFAPGGGHPQPHAGGAPGGGRPPSAGHVQQGNRPPAVHQGGSGGHAAPAASGGGSRGPVAQGGGHASGGAGARAPAAAAGGHATGGSGNRSHTDSR